MFSAALYARVQLFLYHFAHETAGAARIRHSLLPHRRENDWQTSGNSCREKADVYLLFELRIETLSTSLRGASAEARLRAKADATKQSISLPAPLRDGFRRKNSSQ
ncbi:MAG: hypothetical protein V4517_22700 [Pseudomonadota bacterium]